MDWLAEMACALSKQEAKEFARSLGGEGSALHRLDYQLFELLRKNPEANTETLCSILYPKGTRNAYHAQRQYLARQLAGFVLGQRIEAEKLLLDDPWALWGVAERLFQMGAAQASWRYLQRARDVARESGQPALLQHILSIELERTEIEGCRPVLEIIADIEANRKLLDQEEQSALLLARFRAQLDDLRREGKPLDLNALLESMEQLNALEGAMYASARLFFRVMSIIRSISISNKDYYAFEPYLLRHYTAFCAQRGFSAQEAPLHAQLLYMIAHAFYRNKKFSEVLPILDQMCQQFSGMNSAQIQPLERKRLMLLAAAYFFSGAIDQAIGQLEAALRSPAFAKSPNDSTTLTFTLCFYLLYAKQATRASRRLAGIGHTHQWWVQNLGAEWAVKRDLLEVVLLGDLKNEELALNKIDLMKKRWAGFFGNEQYQRAEVFLRFCGEAITDWDSARSRDFGERVEQAFVWVPMEQEDIQAVLYYAWLKSKMTGQDAYQTLLRIATISSTGMQKP